MATHPTNLIVQPKPTVTRYNRVALWLGIGAVVLVACAYQLVIRDHGRTVAEPRRTRLTSLPQPLITALPTVPAPPPTEQPVTWQPPSPPPPAPQKEDPLVALRQKEWQEGLRSPLLVAAFSPDQQGQDHTQAGSTNGHGQQQAQSPQVLEIEPVPRQREQPWAERFASPSPFGNVSGTAPQYLNAQPQPPRSPYMLNAGKMFPVVLVEDVTSDGESFFSAMVTQDVYDSVTGRYLLAPLGSWMTFVSDLDTQTNQQPILQTLAKTLYFPNGWSLPLQGMPGATRLGMMGVQDQVNRHFLQRYGSAALLSGIVAGIRLATYARSGGGFFYAPEDAAINGAGSVMGQTIAEDLRRKLAIKDTVFIRAGYRFNVKVTQDIDFQRPYDQHRQVAAQ